MKPLNLDNRPCSPISSNCVIWQGPELTCINLCKGDTISDVVANLATELCTLLDQTNVSNYDLTCLGITACGPKDFQALIELLIEKICELQGLPTDNTKSDSTCPDCTVTVAPCFIQNGQTTMQLIDYVNMIAERVCGLISQINDLQEQINDLTIRVEILESTPPPTVTIPRVTFSCAVGSLNPGQPYPVDVALQTFINDVWCPMSSALGTPTELLNSIEQPCEFGTDVTSNPGWIANPTTLADSINNIWITLCELYDIVSNISLNVQDTSSVNLNFALGTLTATIQDSGWVDLLGFNHYGAGVAKPQCRRIGNQVHFRGVAIVPIATPCNLNVVAPMPAVDSYNSVAACAVFNGSGGCTINSNGSIQFNNGTSVIPTSIMSSGTNFDNTYGKGYVIGSRQIDIDASYGTGLTAALNVGITSTKQLFFAVVKDLEITTTRPSTISLGTSPLRYITSNVRGNAPFRGCCTGECSGGEYVPDYIASSTDIHNAPANGTFPLVSNTKSAVWPFDCDAGDENQIGGFAVRLDGLIAYIDPCTTDVKSFDCGKGEL